ncbi:MAG: PEP-CTERM sorting domain-containing protein, partial [Planctomycetota bacterium]|nr:PEP-CTERM sorting domain-containing protein [Planctomycetota bacterium]
ASVSQTANVQDQISSPAHNAKYDPDPDNAALPSPPYTSIADWFRTSVNQGNGWSYLSDAPAAFTGYAGYRGYTCTASNQSYGQFTWSTLTGEIDAGRPVMFLVDSSGDGVTDHYVPVFGYDDRGAAGKFYGCYTTWHEEESVDWFQFQPMSTSYAWGVGYATLVTVTPEPATLSLLAVGVLAVVRRRR